MTDRPLSSGTGHKESLIGVCAAIGEDFGFNPDIPRVALAVGLLFAPMIVVGIYVGMGAFVLASRLLFPPTRAHTASATIVPIAHPAPAPAAEIEPLLEAA